MNEAGSPVVAGPVGIDAGLTVLATLSTGETIPALRQRKKLLKRQRRLNRQRDRQQKGSVNRRRTVARLARLHEKTANRRKDHLYKASRGLVEGHARPSRGEALGQSLDAHAHGGLDERRGPGGIPAAAVL